MSMKYQKGSIRSGRSNVFQFRIAFLVLCLCVISILLLYQMWYANDKKTAHYQKIFRLREAHYNTTERKTFVSYVMHAPKGSKQKRHEMCRNNVDVFVGRGVAESPFVNFHFSLVGDTTPTKKLLTAASTFYNVKITFVQMATELNKLVDIVSHVRAMNTLEHQFDDYILLNCGTRGPYFPHSSPSRPLQPSLVWMTSLFAEKLTNGAGVVGSLANSLECIPYVQSHAMAFNYTAAQFALMYWNRLIAENASDVDVDRFVVGVSVALLRQGFPIASLDSRTSDIVIDARNLGPRLPTAVGGRESAERESGGGGVKCRSVDANSAPPSFGGLGMAVMDPCAAGFAPPYGEGDNLVNAPQQTVHAIMVEDRKTNNKKPVLCNRLPTLAKPSWDVASIFDNLTSAPAPSAAAAAFVVDTDTGDSGAAEPARRPFSIDHSSDLAIIVRAHASYAAQLLSLLLSVHASTSHQFRQVRVFVLPTDKDSFETLKETLAGGFPWKNPLAQTKTSASLLRVSLVHFPPWVYDEYGAFLDRICSTRWKHTALKFNIHTAKLVSRYCDVNSPVHYLLVDLVLHYVLTRMTSCQWIITTNADNFYSPLFFRLVAETDRRLHDVVMANMVTKGAPYDTTPYIAGVDLGAYAVSTSFLRSTNASFLTSLPTMVDPQCYHDADGHFIEFLRKHDARILKTDGYYFFHN